MSLALTITDNADGTGGVATISGSAVGSANTLYYALWTGTFGAMAWVSAGSRTGDGTIATAPGNGYYLWQVLSVSGGVTTESGPVYQSLTSGQNTPPARILDAVVQRIKDANLAGLNNNNVVLKWMPRALDTIETFPSIMVCPFSPEDYPGILTSKDDIGIPVLIAIVDQQGEDFTANIDRNENWRWNIIKALRYQPLAAVPEVLQVFPEPTPKMDLSAFEKGKFFGPIVLRFLTRTTRGL